MDWIRIGLPPPITRSPILIFFVCSRYIASSPFLPKSCLYASKPAVTVGLFLYKKSPCPKMYSHTVHQSEEKTAAEWEVLSFRAALSSAHQKGSRPSVFLSQQSCFFLMC